MAVASNDGRVRLSLGDTHSAEEKMNGVDRLEGLSDRLQLALSLFEEAEEVVSELGIEIRNEVERLQRASEGKWDDKMIALVNCLEFNRFQSPIEASYAYTEADDISRLCNWIGELEQPEEPDVAS